MIDELADAMVKSLEAALVALLAVVSLAWLCLKIESLGVFETIRSAVRRMSAFQRFAAAAFLAVFIVFASEKTNSPPANVPPPMLPPLPALPGPANAGSPAGTPGPAEPFALPPEGAVTNYRWFLRGAFEDAVRIPFPDADGFPWHGGMATALTVFACGGFRPDAATAYFPAPFDAPLSLPPLSRRDPSAPSFFWHAATPSNSLLATWENGLYGRDLSHPTNLQAEFFADGSFVYRYPDRATAYPPVLPFDWDGDGLENSVDPDPEAPGPDAHGTNAEWYGVVCSNILSATDGPYGVSLSWLDGASSNAYYFVDVVAEHGPAPIYFTDAAGAVSGDPVVVALAGTTNRVPLVIGPLYSVTSTVPFSISVAEDSIGRPAFGSVQVQPRDGGGYDVRWPVHFSYREESEGEFTVDSEPDGLELEFNWDVPGGVPAMSVQGFASLVLPGFSPLQLPRILGSPWACTCFQPCESNVVLTCSGNCGCGGCMLGGAVSHIGHTLALPTMSCGCPAPYDPHEPQEQHHDPSVPSFSVGFSASAVIYEDAYVDAPGVTVPKRSTEVVVDVSIYGGDKGGRFVINKMNFGRLLQTEPVNIPSGGTIDPNDTLIRNVTCIAAAPSTEEGDVSISGYFVENETGNRINCAASQLTVFKVELTPDASAIVTAPQTRHIYGVNELVQYKQYPSLPALTFNMTSGGAFVMNNNKQYYRCPLHSVQNPLSLDYGTIAYVPQLSVIAPTGIVAGVSFVRKYLNVPDGHAGGLGLVQEFYIRPTNVSFSQIAVEEVPCESSELTGYFDKPMVRLSLNAWSHNTEGGAGIWLDVAEDGLVGNAMDFIDEASLKTELLRIQPDGILTTNTAYGWLNGNMTWDNPFGWTYHHPPSNAPPSGVFATAQSDAKSVFCITSTGDFSVSKLGNTALRTIGGNCFLNGQQVNPVEDYYDPEGNGDE